MRHQALREGPPLTIKIAGSSSYAGRGTFKNKNRCVIRLCVKPRPYFDSRGLVEFRQPQNYYNLIIRFFPTFANHSVAKKIPRKGRARFPIFWICDMYRPLQPTISEEEKYLVHG